MSQTWTGPLFFFPHEEDIAPFPLNVMEIQSFRVMAEKTGKGKQLPYYIHQLSDRAQTASIGEQTSSTNDR